MRICLYTETALPKIGGQELVVDQLARRFQALGHDVAVLAPRPRRPLRADDDDLPYPVIRHPRFYSTRFLVGFYRRWLLKLHRRFPFDLLHCHGVYPPAYLAARCRPRLDVPLVVTSHGGDVREGSIHLNRSTLHQRHVHALEAADALVALSRFTREGFRRMCPRARRVEDIPNGVDLDAFAVPASRPEGLDPAIRPGEYVLFLGRLKRRKGVDLLLEAFRRMSPEDDVLLVVAGDGEERPVLEAQAVRASVAHRVRFVGASFGERKTYLLQNARCTVMPSRAWEAFPLVVLESFASGVPVIASRVPGLEERIEPGRTGLLVPAESPAELARAIREILRHPARTLQWGEEARRAAHEFSWDAVVGRHLELYRDLLAVRRPQAPERLTARRDDRPPAPRRGAARSRQIVTRAEAPDEARPAPQRDG